MLFPREMRDFSTGTCMKVTRKGQSTPGYLLLSILATVGSGPGYRSAVALP